MREIELERTFLVEKLPKDLKKFKSKEIIDIYIPASSKHPVLRVRKNGDRYEITKKYPKKDGNLSELIEETIRLTKEEFLSLSKLKGKKVSKIRFYYEKEGYCAEIGVFKENLKGLILVDFEFKTKKEMDNFIPPEFCLAEVTQEKFLAGGMLCGKKYSDIKNKLKKYNYKK